MIEVKNITKKYGEFYAVRDLNFEVNKGEIVGLLGRNGAGKSTTMNIITGFIEPTDGEVIIDGEDISRKSKNVKRKIGYMPEGTPLYSDLTVKEFINYMADLKMIPKKEKKEAVQKALERTGLERVQHNLTRILSRGYKQRVSLAGAIVGDPEILILDEPTVGLDPKQVMEIRELIKSFRVNHTVIISSHILSEISQICEKVIIIDRGELIAIDTPSNLEKKSTKNQIINVTVEETEENKFDKIKEEIKDISNIEVLNKNDDGSVNYKLITENEKDIRKDISKWCSKNSIIIIEMKSEISTLEEAFVKIIEERVELTQAEIEKIEKEKEITALNDEKREQEELKRRKKEEKELKKAEKEKVKREKQVQEKIETEKSEEKQEEVTEPIITEEKVEVIQEMKLEEKQDDIIQEDITKEDEKQDETITNEDKTEKEEKK